MTKRKEDPLTVLRGPTHYILADGSPTKQGRLCWLWEGARWGEHNAYLELFNRMCQTQPDFGPQEIAFEVYDDE